MATSDCVSVADGRQPAGFASGTGHSPDGSRRSANKVGTIWLAPAGQLTGKIPGDVLSS